MPGVERVGPLDVPDLTAVEIVIANNGAVDVVAARVVGDVRAMDAPTPVQVTGDAARLVDYNAAITERLPWALLVIMLTSFVLLFAFTGSVVVPLKALVMNTLSLGATFGALVWVFQDGHLGWLVGTEALGSLSITTPVLVFAIAFGLSMDYEVLLLGRIAETWEKTGDNDLAIASGLQATGRIVTAAALLMVVRMLLVPATMTLMGRANWWAPPLLRRLHGRMGQCDSTSHEVSEELTPVAG